MDFGDYVRSARKSKGLTLRTVAAGCAVDPGYLSRVENGAVSPSESLAKALAGQLRLDPDALLLLSGRLPPTIQALVKRSPQDIAGALTGLARAAANQPTDLVGIPSHGILKPALEDGFPFEVLSAVAEVESWRKEVYRPIYHTHKWWAQRLGSVFRGIILGAFCPQGADLMDLFYRPVRLPGPVVFDPFMGSGTTIGEAHKLGCSAVGRDINPVAVNAVGTALGPCNRDRLIELFSELEKTTGKKIRRLYETKDKAGDKAQALYYFWVKQLPCPECAAEVDLFARCIFAQHAYPRRHPRVHCVCPHCGEVDASQYTAEELRCSGCRRKYNPQSGPVSRSKATCPSCAHEFPLAKTARSQGHPPKHRLYAKLVLTNDGRKEYCRATDDDLEAYQRASRRLRRRNPILPDVEICHGFNTKQVLNYGYTSWEQMFNDRQLLALTTLAEGIAKLPESPERGALTNLFSGVLEFNNMFASYKGEGTGAVRHMFSHHVLKPERTPLEANVWGTPKSSGSFSTLFESRLLRAIDYREAPFEVLPVSGKNGKTKGRKVFGISAPLGSQIRGEFQANKGSEGGIFLSCGDSARTDLPDECVDLVATDPPFFDNVHYSELADFFHVWQRAYFPLDSRSVSETTRHEAEVQDTDAERFADKLRSVFAECHRVLKRDGLLVFTYHHSREEGWQAIAKAVSEAGFLLVQCHPVKAEMSVAQPKTQAKEPIDLDAIMVCRKRERYCRKQVELEEAMASAERVARESVARFNRSGRHLSRNDTRIIYLGQLLVWLSGGTSSEELLRSFDSAVAGSAERVEKLWAAQSVSELSVMAGQIPLL